MTSAPHTPCHCSIYQGTNGYEKRMTERFRGLCFHLVVTMGTTFITKAKERSRRGTLFIRGQRSCKIWIVLIVDKLWLYFSSTLLHWPFYLILSFLSLNECKSFDFCFSKCEADISGYKFAGKNINNKITWKISAVVYFETSKTFAAFFWSTAVFPCCPHQGFLFIKTAKFKLTH